MARKSVVIDPESFYHITARTINREWFTLQMDHVWHIFNCYLAFISRAYDAKIYDFVLMDNHFHLIAKFPNQNLSSAMLYFMRESSRAISRDSKRINQSFGGRHHKTRITTYQHYLNAYKYVYQNPIRANAVKKVEDYKYSTLPAKLGRVSTLIPLADDLLISDLTQQQNTLEWLNQPPSEINLEAVKRALRRTDFSLPNESSNRKKHSLELGLL